MTTLYGNEAIAYAAKHDLTLNKATDPTEEARSGLCIEDAIGIAKQDPSLIWIDVGGRVVRWDTGSGVTGYRATDLLIDENGNRVRVVSTGHGVQLEPA